MRLGRRRAPASAEAVLRVLHPAVISVMLAAAGCSAVPTITLSPDNLKLEIQSDVVMYNPLDTFSGTLTFTSTGQWRIREAFPSEGQYHIDFYDNSGVLQRSYFPNAQYPRVTYFELEPLAARTDTLRVPLSLPNDTLPDGEYRVLAWVEGHADVNSETTIHVNS